MERPAPAVHRTIVVVDVEGFGDLRRTSTHRVAVRAGLYRVLRSAFEQAGVCWDDCDHEDRGDGIFVLAPAHVPKAPFADTVPHALVRALRAHNSTHSHEARIRLRMALHAGEVTYDEHGVTATAINHTFRLLDAAPLKTALAESPGVLAVITSGWFFDEVVRNCPGSDAATYRPVRISVKETTTTAWISLPDHPYPPAAPSLRPLDELPVPRQLPLAIRDFTGRAEHLAALNALCGDVGAVVITAIDGTAGVGKTALAVYWAHRVQHQFPDGTLYVNLRGYGPGQPATPEEVLDSFLSALGCPPQRIPIGLEAQSALYRSLLAGRRVLIVLDNANAADQVRPLLPGSPGCLVLITSRASLTGLVVNEAASRLTLDLLTSTEALELVHGILGSKRIAAEPEAVNELIRMCARLPLALRIAASLSARRPHHSIADVIAEMTADRDPTAVRAVFDWSYNRLDPDQARLFRRLGLHPGPEFSIQAAAAVADLTLTDTRRLLDILTDAHLLEEVARDRYRFHDLLRAYAADRAEHDDPGWARDQARRILLAWYANSGLAACRAVYPAITDPHPFRTRNAFTHLPITFADTAHARAWLRTEQSNLIAAAHHAAGHDLPKLTILISYASIVWLFRQGEWTAILDLAELELNAARHSGDRHAECSAQLDRAEAQIEVRQWTEAAAACQEALALARMLDNPWFEAIALAVLGWICIAQSRHFEAIEYLLPAVPLSQGPQWCRLQGVVETNLGSAYLGQGRYEKALFHCERGLALREQAGDREGEAFALGQIARIRQETGAHSEAIGLCQHALSLGYDHVYLPDRITILETLGTSLQHIGDIEGATACWSEAVVILDRFADPRADELRARLLDLSQ